MAETTHAPRIYVRRWGGVKILTGIFFEKAFVVGCRSRLCSRACGAISLEKLPVLTILCFSILSEIGIFVARYDMKILFLLRD